MAFSSLSRTEPVKFCAKPENKIQPSVAMPLPNVLVELILDIMLVFVRRDIMDKGCTENVLVSNGSNYVRCPFDFQIKCSSLLE